jgi:hypothetical protein
VTEEKPYERDENDGFYTDPRLASVIVKHLVNDGWVEPGLRSVLEPSVGKGAFADAVFIHIADGGLLHMIDVNPAMIAAMKARPRAPHVRVGDEVSRLCLVGDFLDEELTADGRYELIIGNPPFGKKVEGRKVPLPVAEKHVRRALSLRDRGGVVAFLLRSAFFESTGRIPFWREHPASGFYPLAERPSFTGDGKTDKGQAYGLFIWKRGHRGPRFLGEHIVWCEEKE